MDTAKRTTHGLSALLLLILPLLFTGCATITPPIQEMSDARQAIRAAHEANARKYAPDALTQAEVLLQEATSHLDEGDFDRARAAAVEARLEAIRARDRAAASPRRQRQ